MNSFRKFLLLSLAITLILSSCDTPNVQEDINTVGDIDQTGQLAHDETNYEPETVVPSASDGVGVLSNLSFDEFLEESYKLILLRDPEAITSLGIADELGVSNDLLTVNQVAQHFAKDPRTIRRWVAEGRLPGAHYIPGRFGAELRIPREALYTVRIPKRPAPEVRTCAGVKRDGSPCGATALRDSPYCRWHQRQGESDQ